MPLGNATSVAQYNAVTTHVKGLVTHPDEDAVRAALDSVAHIESNYKAAKVLGVSEATVRRWRAGAIAVPLREPTRSALERYLARHNKQRDEIVSALDDLEAYTKALISRAGPPGQQRARKRDILRGLRIMITATDPLPEWWYDLEEEVDRGEL